MSMAWVYSELRDNRGFFVCEEDGSDAEIRSETIVLHVIWNTSAERGGGHDHGGEY